VVGNISAGGEEMSKERDEIINRIKRSAGFDSFEAAQYANGYLAAKNKQSRSFGCSFWLSGWHDYQVEHNTGVYS